MVSRRAVVSGLVGLAAAGPARADLTEALKALNALTARFDQDGRYLPPWQALRTSPVQVSDMIEQWAAFLGDEGLALASAAGEGGAVTGPPPEAHEAIETIVADARGRRVVILNEAHCASRHRMFLTHLLRALRKDGFTHFAAETFLNAADPKAPHVERLRAGDQLTPQHGYYIRDPVFAEAVREALQLGYRLVGYEARADQYALGDDAEHIDRGREQGQATNLEEAMAAAPDGRFLVYVGYGHIVTDLKAEGGPRFAGLFAKDTAAAPLTVVQDSTGSFGPHAPDNNATQTLLALYKPKGYLAIRPRKGGDGWSPDLLVFHPNLADVHGRPGWLAADPGRRLAVFDLPRPVAEAPALAQAVPAADSDPAIPADQHLLSRGARSAQFYLRPGRYRVRLETLKGIQTLGQITV